MKNILTYLAICLGLLQLGCDGNEIGCESKSPKKLIGDFNSYQTMTQFKESTKEKADTLISSQESSFPKTDGRPDFSIHTLTVSNYKIENVTGSLKAIFFNDRLMSIMFYPHIIGEFESILKMKYSIILEGSKNKIIKCVELRHGTDSKGKKYFSWSDIELVKEQNEWISQHA